ncbi:MAG: glycosyltransferase family 4 protein [Phycisphaerae bacterium]
MHVVLDFNPALRERFSGFWTYGQGLLGGLLADSRVEQATLLCWQGALDAARDFTFRDHPKVRLLPVSVKLRWWERLWLVSPWPSLQQLCGQFDVYHSFHHLMPPSRGTPRVLTVHDLRQYRMPELYPGCRKWGFERAVRRADRIIAYSDWTARDLMEILRVPAQKVDVVPLATTGSFAQASPQQAQRTRQWLSSRMHAPVGRYALAIGSPDRRKNLAGVVRAFALARPRLPDDFRLVLAGNVDPGENLPSLLASGGIADSVLLTGPLGQEELHDVMASADVFVFLSLYEGFGLPLLEAMSAGVPVISSNRSAMPEVVGDAGRLVDPLDAAAVAEELVHVCTEPTLRGGLAASGLRRAKEFTWTRTAAGTVECYLRAIQACRQG